MISQFSSFSLGHRAREVPLRVPGASPTRERIISWSGAVSEEITGESPLRVSLADLVVCGADQYSNMELETLTIEGKAYQTSHQEQFCGALPPYTTAFPVVYRRLQLDGHLCAVHAVAGMLIRVCLAYRCLCYACKRPRDTPGTGVP